MAIEDLKPYDLSTRTPEERKEIARKGGSVSSPKKKLAAKIRALKYAKSENKNLDRITDLLTDAQLSGYDLLRYIDELQKENLSVEQRIKIVNLRINTHKLIFGEKQAIAIAEMSEKPSLADELVNRFLSKNEF